MNNNDSLEIISLLAQQEASAEQARTQTLDSKTFSLIGFSGIIATLNAGFVPLAFNQISSSRSVKILFTTSSGTTISALVLAAILGLVSLYPREFESIKVEEIQKLMNRDIIDADPFQIKGSIGQTRVNTLAADRLTNNRKANYLKACFISIGMALIFLLIQFASIMWLIIK